MCLVLASAFTAGAQQKHTIYFENGKKAIEGKWTYTIPLPAAFNEIASAIRGMEGSGRLLTGLQSRQFDFRQPQYGLAFDGLIQFWYPDGTLWRRANYKSAALNGACENHYPDGRLYSKGAYVNGMEDGEWNYYYPDGKLKMRLNTVAYTQDELDELFKSYTKTKSAGAIRRSSASADRRIYTISQHVIAHFREPRSKIPGGLNYSGRQLFYDQTGQPEAELNYDHRLADGKWILYDEGKKFVEAEFKKDSIIALHDRTGKDMLADPYFSDFDDVKQLFLTPKEEAEQKARRSRSSATDYSVMDPGPVGIDPGYADGVEPPQPRAFRFVEQMPEFRGDMSGWLSKNLVYPESAKKNGVEGRVIVQFIVRKDGSLEDVTITRGVGNEALESEAKRVIHNMPKWKPGRQQGKEVDVYFTLPITFKL